MFVYQVIIEYDGTDFVGWQMQKNGSSVQEAIQRIFSKVLKQKINLNGSGRTDSGVHALAQSAHFTTKKEINNFFFFLNTVNFFLNKKKISILKISKKKLDFHARYSATKRIYKYVIINRASPLTLDSKKAWHIRSTLDTKLMKKAAEFLQGTKDFSTYRSSSCGAKSAIKTLEYVKIGRENNKIIIIFKSRSFLQQQVRSMTGCIKLVGEGKWTLKRFKEVMNLKKRSNCAPPAPPHGLYLCKVIY